MTAETEVSMNVGAVFEEVKGLGMSSYQEPPVIDCCGVSSQNKVGDSDNLCLSLTGANGFSDDLVGDKEEGVVVIEDSVDESNAVFEVLNRNLDVDNGNGKVNDFLEEGGDGNEEEDSPVLIFLSLEQEMSREVNSLGMSSYQDPPNIGCCGISSQNEVGDSDNLCLTVTGANGFSDDLVGDKEEGVVAIEDSVVESNAVFDVLNSNLDMDDGEVSGYLEEGGDGNEEVDSPVVNCLSLKQEMSHVDNCLIVCDVADSIDQSEKTESQAEAEIKHVEDLNGTLESLEGGDQDGNFEGLTSNEYVNVEDLINSESNPASVENSESQVEAAGLVVESKQEESNNANVGCDGQVELCQESSHGAAYDVDDKLQEVSVEGGIKAEAEIAEDEVPLEASSDSDPEYSISNEETVEEKMGLNNLLTCKSDSDITNETGSPHVIVDGVECELQKASTEGQNEAIIEVEAAEREVPLDTSIDPDSEPYPINNNEEAFQEEPKTTLGSDVMENQECNTVPINSVQDGLDLMNEEKTTDRNSETLSHLVLEENNNVNLSVSEVEDSAQDHEEPKKHPDANVISPVIMLSDIEASVQTQSLPASYVHEPWSEIDMHVAETIGIISSSPADSSKPEIVANGLSGHESHVTCTSTEEGPPIQFGSIICCNGKEPTFLGGAGLLETGVSNGKPEVIKSSTIKVKSDHFEVHASSATSSKDMTNDGTGMCETEFLDSVDVNNESSNILLEIVDVKDKRDQLNGTDTNLLLQKNEGTQNFQNDSVSLASQEGSSNDEKAVTKPFNYLMKIPRYDDESLKEEIRLAKLQLDEKTIPRNAIQVKIQEQRRANSQVHSVEYKHAKDEDRNARNLVRSKRMEIDSLQSMINKAKNATTIEDTSRRINDMERRIQHETITLKEEKQLIREIQQQKQLRERLSSNMGNQDEIKRAVEQREQFEEQLKNLRKEVDILKQNVSKAEAATVEAERKYDGERKKVEELQAQFKAANDICQVAYLQWQSLKAELSEKHKLFYKYKKDASAANKYAFRRDTERLYRHCQNHMQEFIELWNTNVEFRNEYTRLNARSTVRRLGNLDGRSRGPNEDPPIPPSSVDKIVSTPPKVDPILQSSLELKQEIPIKNGISEDKSIKKVTQLKQEIPIKNGISEDKSMKKVTQLKQETNIKNGISEDKSMKKVTQHKIQVSETKGPAKHVKSNGVATFSGKDDTEEVHKEHTKSKEEIELERKAEEIRKKEAEAKLKEQHRLEELTKAMEALERKKRQAEKEQKRAELKAQKEAEQKEKNREKRQRKKEKKKAVASDVNDSNNNDDTAPITKNTIETVEEIEANGTSSVTTKNPKKPKGIKKKPVVPLSICNRNRKKWQQYAWIGVGVAGLLAFVLLWLVYPEVFSVSSLKW